VDKAREWRIGEETEREWRIGEETEKVDVSGRSEIVKEREMTLEER
jgi:hypothetical protein